MVTRHELKHFHRTCYTGFLSEETKRYLKNIDEYLGLLGEEMDTPGLELNSRGICAFRYSRFVIVVEVPLRGRCLFLYTVVHQIDSRDKERASIVMKRALELNYLSQDTCGAVISLDKSVEDSLEFTLSYTHPMGGMDCNEFCNIVMNFMSTARDVYKKLMAAVEEQSETEQKSAKESNGGSETLPPLRRSSAKSLPLW